MEGHFAATLDENAALLVHHWEEAGEAIVVVNWHDRVSSWGGLAGEIDAKPFCDTCQSATATGEILVVIASEMLRRCRKRFELPCGDGPGGRAVTRGGRAGALRER